MQYINNIPAGYKDSAVGIIPQEWEAKRIKDLGSVITGSTPPTADVSNYGSEYMFVSPADLSDHQKYVLTTEKMLSPKGYAISRKMPKGTILYTCIGSTIGKIGIASRALTSNQQINAVICNDANEYLYYALLFTTDRIKMLAGEQAVPIINKSEFENIKLAVPPIAEQRKIAEILGVWDEAIEKQSRLIEKLELRKRGLMQRLLIGRTRLPGFTTPWQKVKLGEIGKISSAGVDKKVNEGEVPVRLLNFVDVFYRDFIYNDELTHWVTAKPIKVEQCSVQKGDIFFTPSSEMPTDIAISAVAMEDMKGVVYSYHIVRLRPHIEMDLHYRAYAFKTDEFYKQAERICDGSGQRYVISQDGFRNMSIHLPSLPEQKAIAEVLTMADNEIATHRKKLDALRLQKRGLMQQLLTGKTRVKI